MQSVEDVMKARESERSLYLGRQLVPVRRKIKSRGNVKSGDFGEEYTEESCYYIMMALICSQENYACLTEKNKRQTYNCQMLLFFWVKTLNWGEQNTVGNMVV